MGLILAREPGSVDAGVLELLPLLEIPLNMLLISVLPPAGMLALVLAEPIDDVVNCDAYDGLRESVNEEGACGEGSNPGSKCGSDVNGDTSCRSWIVISRCCGFFSWTVNFGENETSGTAE